MKSANAYVYKHTICYEDTNAVGNVYYARYVAWQGKVRELFLKEHVPDMCVALETGRLALATLSVSCEYHQELFAFQEVNIELRLGAIAGSTMTLVFEYWKVAEPERVLAATGQQRIRCLRREGRALHPVPIPDYFENAVAPYRIHAPQPV